MGAAIAPHLSEPAIAQILPDDTLGSEASRIVPSSSINENPATLIEGGAARDRSLFHSFEQFNIEENQSVYFDSPSDISTIFSRVTGTDISNILGTLGVSGPADLFFINPNGIVFGPNATLDISGSLFVSTAESLLFENNLQFSSRSPQAPPLLTISAPIGLQYGANPGAINAQGTGHSLSLSLSDSRVAQDYTLPGLQSQPDQTLALIGGDITLSGAVLTTTNGQIEVGSVGPNSTVSLSQAGDRTLTSYESVERFGNIQLTESAAAIATEAASIQLSGQRILFDSSAVLLATEGANLSVAATEELRLSGALSTPSEPTPFLTSLLLQNEPKSAVVPGTLTIKTPQLSIDGSAGVIAQNFGTGSSSSSSFAGGGIDIQAQQIQLQNGAFLFTGTYDDGPGSNIKIESQQLQVENALIAASTFSTGLGGDIDVETDLFQVQNQSTIATDSFAAGRAGDLNVRSQQVQLQGRSLVSANGRDAGAAGAVNIQAQERIQIVESGVFSETFSPEAGSRIDLFAPQIQISEGALVSSATRGTGPGGNIDIRADQLQLTGSGVSANTLGSGSGGNVSVQAQQIDIERGRISAQAVLGTGSGGNITLTAADTITLFDRADVNTESSTTSTGNGGDIAIQTGSLLLEQGSQLVSRSSGEGNAGSVTIQAADAVTLKEPWLSLDGSFDIPTAILALLEFQSVGEGGNVDITTEALSVLDGSEILANTFGDGDAGNITIQAGGKVTVDGVRPLSTIPGGIFSNVGPGGVGNAGQVDIQAAALSVTNGARVASSVEGTAAIPGRPAGVGTGGEINVKASDVLLLGTNAAGDRISGLFTDTQAGAVGDGGRITIQSDTLRVANGAQINSQTENASNSGNVEIDTSLQLTVDSGSEITVSSRDLGSAGNLLIAAPSVVLDNGEITAQTNSGDGGNINLQVEDVLLLRNGSELSSTAGSARTGGDGGDILIAAGFIAAIAQENSDITANAFNGQGGSISVNTQGVLGIKNRSQLTFESDITASSELGQNGVVIINNPEIPPRSEDVALPINLPSPLEPVGQSLCSNEDSEFTVSGTGGLPVSPYNTLNGSPTWEDWYISEENPVLNHSENAPKTTALSIEPAENTLQEAQRWGLDTSGNVVISLDTTLSSTTQSSPTRTVSCQQIKEALFAP